MQQTNVPPPAYAGQPYGQIHPALAREIQKNVRAGYRVIEQTQTSAQLVRPKKFSCMAASLSFLLVGVGLLFYLFWYWGKKEDVLYLQVVNDQVVYTRGK
jgi:hypothetical protein